MKKLRLYAIISFTVLLLTACFSNVREPVSTEDQFNPKMAYVYGHFRVSRDSNGLFYLRLEPLNAGNNQHYLLKFGYHHEVRMISLPPGRYNINSMESGSPQRAQMFKFKNPVVVDLKPGKAHYLGDFVGYSSTVSDYPYIRYRWKLKKISSNFSGANAELERRYRHFRNTRKVNEHPGIVTQVISHFRGYLRRGPNLTMPAFE